MTAGGGGGNCDGVDRAALWRTPSPSKGVVKTRRAAAAAARTPASVMVRLGGDGVGGVSAGRSGAGGGRRRRPAPSAVTRRLALDFGDAPEGPSAVADAEASVRAAATDLSAAVADGFAARWDFDVRRGQPVESPAVWHWSPVEA